MQHKRQWLYLRSALDLINLLDRVGVKSAACKAVNRFRRNGNELPCGYVAECLEGENRWQDACLLAMQALQALSRAEEAVRFFERCKKALHRELEMEPGVPLLEAQQRALMSPSS